MNNFHQVSAFSPGFVDMHRKVNLVETCFPSVRKACSNAFKSGTETDSGEIFCANTSSALNLVANNGDTAFVCFPGFGAEF